MTGKPTSIVAAFLSLWTRGINLGVAKNGTNAKMIRIHWRARIANGLWKTKRKLTSLDREENWKRGSRWEKRG